LEPIAEASIVLSFVRFNTLGRKNCLFVGSEGGGKAAAIAYTLIENTKLNGVDPQAWLTDVLSRSADHKVNKLDELLRWRYADDGSQSCYANLKQCTVAALFCTLERNIR
jgi:hypothetical protein